MREVDLPTDYEQADSDLGDYDTTKPACYSVNRNQDLINWLLHDFSISQREICAPVHPADRGTEIANIECFS